MAGKKKFGTFAGVFTPSILTILGVIMYMRLGWVVGNAGLVGAIIIVLIAHVIAITTGLSVSSVATDKKIGAGGIYYVLSRSMGVPIGGSIGIALYVGTAFSIALYLIGFAESFNGYFGLGMTVDAFRVTGTISLLLLTGLALISTSAALKAQFFILAAIIASLVSIFFGTSDFAPETVSMFGAEGAAPLETVFAIFFPAVTGFTAGIAMSGDLEDPKKAIPVGTLLAIGTGLVVYLSLTIFIAYSINPELLRSDYNILMKMSYFAPAVVAGIWGATLSSALGGILGGPRILQAMSLDKITPMIFGKGKGKDNEPVNALMLVFLIAEAGILIGELDVIARVVSMFYLTAYGFINISYFLESWANPDFQPTFKIKRWIGFLGFVACFGVMFKLDMIAMLGALIVVGMLYFWLQRKEIKLQSNDVWQSVWSNVVNKGLKKLEEKENENSNWNPNLLLFTDSSPHRNKLLEFSKAVSGRRGIVTDFKLITESEDDPFAKNEQSFKDDKIEELGIYGKKIEVDDIYVGIENIASTYGFTGIEPNTVMMNWSRSAKDPAKYAKMTQKLLHLDYNLLYLDYDERTHFGSYQSIDLWWRETDSNNAEMMLNIARYVSQSPDWLKAKIRILFVNHNNADTTLIKAKISKLVDKLRIDAEIKIINNGVEQKSFYQIIELQSIKTDLIILGIPNVNPEEQAQYIMNTDHLFETVGTTLLVKASNNFNALDLNFIQSETFISKKSAELKALKLTESAEINELVVGLDDHLLETAKTLAEPTFNTLSSNYYKFITDTKIQFGKVIEKIKKNDETDKIVDEIQSFLKQLIVNSNAFKTKKIPEIEGLFKTGLASFIEERKEFLASSPKLIKYRSKTDNKKKKIYWQSTLESYYTTKILPHTKSAFYEFGVQNFIILNKLAEGIKEEAQLYIEKISIDKGSLTEFVEQLTKLFDELQETCSLLKVQVIFKLNIFERGICNELLSNIETADFYTEIQKTAKRIKSKATKENQANIADFASNWRRNQTLAHEQLQADFSLSDTGLAVFAINEKIRTRVNKETIAAQQEEIELLQKVIGYVMEHLATDKLVGYSNELLDKLVGEIPHIDFGEILEKEENKVLEVSDDAPKRVNVVSANSFNNLVDCQNEEVEVLEVSLANIQSYIIQSSYLSPLQDSLGYLEQVHKKNAEELYNSSNLIKHILDQPFAEDLETYKRNLAEVGQRIADCAADLKKIETSFNYDLNVHIHNTLTSLSIRMIIESIDSYAKVSQHSIKQTSFQKWYQTKKEKAAQKYKDVYEFIVQGKRDVEHIKFIEKHKQFFNKIESTNQFIIDLTVDEKIEQELSFYYRKLFTGSHLGTVSTVYKSKEIKAVENAVFRIDSGIDGAVVVLGESFSGKSYFLETVSKNLLKGEIVYINKPTVQKFDGSDIDRAFQQAFNMKGSAEAILNKLDKKRVLVFENLEKWWVKAPNGHLAIDYLSRLIGKFGKKHYFLLSCNIFSFDIIRKVSKIDRQLLATVIIPPASKLELKELILNRHKTAGAELWYKNNLISEAKDKDIDAFFNDIYYKSKGNVGLALGLWINSIYKDENERLNLKKIKSIRFPKVNSPDWKILLYHFVIHRGLTEQQIERVFEDKEWVYSILKELEKTTLVYKKSATEYGINAFAKHYVEDWLKELKILN